MAENNQMWVFSNPAKRRDKEYNRWYDDVHLGEVLEIPEFVAAQRFRLSDTQMNTGCKFEYVAVYEFDCNSATAIEALSKASPGFDMSDALGERMVTIVQAVTKRRTS